MSLTPQAAYDAALASGKWQSDPAQAAAVHALDALYAQVVMKPSLKQQGQRLLSLTVDAPNGVYLFGDVGAGKTWLMDLFYHALPVRKWRVHFHQFMREVHRELTCLQGQVNPLKRIAKHLSHKARVICFDELFVGDIADAMLLGELLQFLFKRGVVVVATSNVAPDDLYRNGLQRARFLPAIDAIKAHMDLVQVRSLKDYRWLTMVTQGVYFTPFDESSEAFFKALYFQLSGQSQLTAAQLTINQREIACKSCDQEVVWFDFATLCSSPRSIQDYVVLTKQYRLFFLENVPLFTAKDEDAAWYFIGLVDVLYDARCRLVIRAEAPLLELYQGEKFNFEFQRTTSRLHEMQGASYWV